MRKAVHTFLKTAQGLSFCQSSEMTSATKTLLQALRRRWLQQMQIRCLHAIYRNQYFIPLQHLSALGRGLLPYVPESQQTQCLSCFCVERNLASLLLSWHQSLQLVRDKLQADNCVLALQGVDIVFYGKLNACTAVHDHHLIDSTVT